MIQQNKEMQQHCILINYSQQGHILFTIVPLFSKALFNPVNMSCLISSLCHEKDVGWCLPKTNGSSLHP